MYIFIKLLQSFVSSYAASEAKAKHIPGASVRDPE